MFTNAIDETQALRTSDIVNRVKATGLLFEPGTKRLYSSAGYTCLAKVLEIIEKKSFEQLLQENVFAKADMKSAINASGRRLISERATPHVLSVHNKKVEVVNAPYKDLRFLTGSGSAYATTDDLLRFVQAIRNGVFGEVIKGRTFDGDAMRWRGFTGRNKWIRSVDRYSAR